MEDGVVKTDIKWIKDALEGFKEEWGHFHKTMDKIKDVLKSHENKLNNHENKFKDFEDSKSRNQKFWEKMILGLSIGTAVAVVSYLLTLI